MKTCGRVGPEPSGRDRARPGGPFRIGAEHDGRGQARAGWIGTGQDRARRITAEPWRPGPGVAEPVRARWITAGTVRR